MRAGECADECIAFALIEAPSVAADDVPFAGDNPRNSHAALKPSQRSRKLETWSPPPTYAMWRCPAPRDDSRHRDKIDVIYINGADPLVIRFRADREDRLIAARLAANVVDFTRERVDEEIAVAFVADVLAIT